LCRHGRAAPAVKEGTTAQTLKLDGPRPTDVIGLTARDPSRSRITLKITRKNGAVGTCRCAARIDTPIEIDYYQARRHPAYVLRQSSLQN